MSSEENEDSLKLSISTNNNKIDIVSSVLDDKCEVITKCLTSKPHWNEIPCCSSNVTNVSVTSDVVDSTGIGPDHEVDLVTKNGDKKVSDFIVIDLTCDVNDVCESINCERNVGGTNTSNIDCDPSSIRSLDSSQSLVPVLNNEIVNTENQKLVSLSLSILLAALLQAMRCFAQFLEDIVIPQR
ncbi:uncharacterized protein LOC128201657 [Galleria mellonella]|uniref:Uncharacterized protein LOC128201657 n=1 Tax=Galleria mellonella TaxID=7137 RepID=A0ABM3MVP1_GALME|nr:uncharacterized protein LOC128201657 [Galleria mellonella]